MKRVLWGALTATVLLSHLSMPALALDTSPSSQIPGKINGPLLITGYSFTGHSLKYIQIYNSSSEVASIAGWKVTAEYAAYQVTYAALSGKIAPGKYVTVANIATLPSATFTFSDAVASSDPVFTSISLQPPAESNFNSEIASPGITTSTPRVAGSPATFYFSRNTSTTTGNYLTTFTAFIPGSTFTVVSDGLYQIPAAPSLQITEIFSDSSACPPNATALTCSDYVKLYNPSSTAVDVSLFRLRTGALGQSATSSNSTQLSGVVASNGYIAFPISLSSSGSWVWLEDRYGTTRYDSTIVQYPSSQSHENAWGYNPSTGQWQWTELLTAGDAESVFPTPKHVNSCSGLVVSEVAANVASEDQFIEVMNSSQVAMDLTGCVLQTNRSTVAVYTFADEQMAPGERKLVYVKDTPLTLTKTTSGTVYILSSDLLTEVSQVSYENLDENTSWALVDGIWRQTYSQSPGGDNMWQEYLPCSDGYFRNLETGLCNKVAAVESLADCGEGKYRSADTNRCRSVETSTGLAACDTGQTRNPETNRCRSLASTASLLTPCAVNQERNPNTNRCRNVTASSTLKPCAANQERNPETNRCRNKTSASKADFPVEAVAESGQATLGWWAFGGVGMVAAGYAGWEWRRETLSAIRKVGQFIAGRF